jgi:hypothetical protein
VVLSLDGLQVRAFAAPAHHERVETRFPLQVVFDNKQYPTVTHTLTELQFYLYHPPTIFVYLTKGTHEGFSQLNVVRCVDRVSTIVICCLNCMLTTPMAAGAV